MTAETSAAARPTAGKAAQARATILAFLYNAAPSAPLSSEALIQRMNAARIGVRDPNRPVTLISPSGTRTRIDELARLGYVEVADTFGRTIAGNACRRYRITEGGRLAIRRHLLLGDLDLDGLAAEVAEQWVAYRRLVARPEPAKLLAEVVSAAIGRRVEVRLVDYAGSRIVGWLDHGDTADLVIAADLINRED